jgi:hypothetical protein
LLIDGPFGDHDGIRFRVEGVGKDLEVAIGFGLGVEFCFGPDPSVILPKHLRNSFPFVLHPSWKWIP